MDCKNIYHIRILGAFPHFFFPDQSVPYIDANKPVNALYFSNIFQTLTFYEYYKSM